MSSPLFPASPRRGDAREDQSRPADAWLTSGLSARRCLEKKQGCPIVHAALDCGNRARPAEQIGLSRRCSPEGSNDRECDTLSSACPARPSPGRPGARRAASTGDPAAKPALLAGGNPQIAKADGDAPVQAYIAAMPGWKRDVGRRLDALIVRTVPDVRKAVKWNSPFYGIEGQGWFLSFHCFTKYVKVAFFRGTSLRPLPPGESKNKDTRYLDIHEDDPLDEELVASWIRQASELPGWVP